MNDLMSLVSQAPPTEATSGPAVVSGRSEASADDAEAFASAVHRAEEAAADAEPSDNAPVQETDDESTSDVPGTDESGEEQPDGGVDEIVVAAVPVTEPFAADAPVSASEPGPVETTDSEPTAALPLDPAPESLEEVAVEPATSSGPAATGGDQPETTGTGTDTAIGSEPQGELPGSSVPSGAPVEVAAAPAAENGAHPAEGSPGTPVPDTTVGTGSEHTPALPAIGDRAVVAPGSATGDQTQSVSENDIAADGVDLLDGDASRSAPLEAPTGVAETSGADVAEARPAPSATINAAPTVTASGAPVDAAAPTAATAAADAPVAQQLSFADDPNGVRAAIELAEAITDMRRLGDGVHRLNLRLHPRELGSLHLRVELRDGTIQLAATTDNEVARITMSRSLPELRAQLEQAGLSTGSLDVGVDPRSDGSADRYGTPTDAAAPQRSSGPITETTSAPTETRDVVAAGRVDLRL